MKQNGQHTAQTGLNILKSIMKGDIPIPAMARTIPMTITSVEPGIVGFTARAGQQHLNTMGGVHGGFAATVLDTVTGCAIHSLLDAGVECVTIDLAIKMLRPVPLDLELTAIGKTIHLSGHLGVSEGTLTDSEGKIYAHATATYMILRPQNHDRSDQETAHLKDGD